VRFVGSDTELMIGERWAYQGGMPGREGVGRKKAEKSKDGGN
jgi:hypothetical protein